MHSLEDRITPSYTPSTGTFTNYVSQTGYTNLITGTSSATDDATASIVLGGTDTFNFYGTTYTTIYASTNGVLSVVDPVSAAANTDLSVTPQIPGVIAPLWDDWFSPNTGTTVAYKVVGNDLIVKWGTLESNAVSPPNYGGVSFAAVLKLNTTTPGGIEFHYTNVIADTQSGNQPTDNGASATVGVKRPGIADSTPNETETRTLVSFNTAGGSIGNGKAIALTWTNTPPVVTAANLLLSSSSINEGGSVSLDGSFTDTNDIDPHTVTINWGDGTPNTVFVLPAGTTSFAGKTHTYADNPSGQPTGSYTITVTVADLTQSGSATKQVQVNNVAPAINAGTSTTIAEGSTFTRTVTFTDVPVDGLYTATVDYNDGKGQQAVPLTAGVNSFGLNFTPPDDDSTPYVVVVRVTDKDGGLGTATFNLNVTNVDPAINAASLPAVSQAEGSVVTILPTFSDVGFENLNPTPATLETFTYEVDWNDGTPKDTGTATISGIGGVGVPTTGTFTQSHVYADDGIYTVTVKVFDDDGGVATRTFTATIGNVAPTLTVPASGQAATEGTVVSFPSLGQYTDPGFDNALLTKERFFYEISWGDGTGIESGETIPTVQGTRAPTLTRGTFGGSHTYADNGTYTVTVKLTDDDGNSDTETFTVVVANANPILTVPSDQSVTEGALLSLPTIGTFTDKGFNNSLAPTSETFQYAINWGDGTVQAKTTVGAVTQGSVGIDTTGFFGGSHRYADDGTYTVTVTVYDDDGGSDTETFTVTVGNAAPVLTVSANKTIAEGSQLSIAQIGTFTDAGFNNPSNPAPAGPTTETFSYTINWGDGTAPDSSSVSAVVQGSPGVLTTGTFAGAHTYADNGVYTVTVTVTDDNGGSDVKTFQVTVTNAAPVLTVVPNQSRFEGQLLSLTNIGTFTDRGYDNALNPAPGETTERFQYTVNWGDGRSDPLADATIDTPGSAGTPTGGSFDASHTYADEGVYTVTVTVFDDDGGTDTKTFTVTVSNVPPTLTTVGVQTSAEGEVLSIPTIGTFTDPGFDNPLNPLPGDRTERFSYVIDWGDGNVDPSKPASITTAGSPGVSTAGTFGGSHIYADDGLYTVTVTLTDDNGGTDVRTFQVTVGNQNPVLAPVANRSVVEGALLSVPGIGSFTDKGFNNALNSPGEVDETFTYTINWGDGTAPDSSPAAAVTPGGPGTLTTGTFNGSHRYADDGVYTVTVTVFDDDGGSAVQTFAVTVSNANPILAAIPNQSLTEGDLLSLTPLGSFTDAGFNNPGGSPATVESFTYSITWGDGPSVVDAPVTAVTTGSPGVATVGSFPGSHTFADNGTYTVSVTVKDDNGGTATQSFQVTVANAAPTLTVLGNQAVNEGAVLSLPGIGTFTDPGFSHPTGTPPTAETFTYSINWGDGKTDSGSVSSVVNGSAGVPTQGTIDGSHTYADGGTYTVTVTVTDDNGGSDTDTFTVTVSNVVPTFALNPALAASVNGTEGAAVSLANIGTFTDPGFDNPLSPFADKTERFTYTVNWGDGSPNSTGPGVITTAGSVGTLTAGGFGTSHVFLDEGNYTVTASVSDDNGGASSAFTFTVVIANVAPSALTLAPSVASPTEGTPFTLAGSFADPGVLDTHTVRVAWGDGTPDTVANLGAGVLSFAGLGHTYRDNGAYPVVVTVTDDSGESVVLNRTLTVLNAAPTVAVPTIPDTRVGRTVTVTAVVADLGASDSPATTWSVADPLGRVVATGTGTTAAFRPVRAGAFTVTFTARDKDGAVTSAAGVARVFTNELLVAGVGGGVPTNSVQVYNPDRSPKFAINPYPGFSGGVRVATADVNGDGIDDVITGAGFGGGPQVSVYDGVSGVLLSSFAVFEDSFRSGIFVTGGDIDGDGFADVVVSADRDGGPRVIVFRGSDIAAGKGVNGVTGQGVLVSFFGIQDPNFRGGARTAVGDFNGDGFADVAVAAGFGGGPRISVWDGKSLATGSAPANPFANFFAFEDALRNGAFVGVGDVNGDRVADLVLGGGPGGGPRVRIVDGASLIRLGGFGALDGNLASAQLANFFSGDPASTGGVYVAAADLDEDGLAEVISGSGDGQRGVVRVYLGSQALSAPSNPTISDSLAPFDANLLFGVYVG